MRHVVRKIETNRTTPFDDRWWPVALALVALGGTVLAGLHFARPAASTGLLDFWGQLTIAVTLGAVCAAAWVRPQRGRRRLLLSLALSLMLNGGLLGLLSWMEIVHPAWEPPVTAQEPEPQPELPVPTVPEYFPLATEGRDRPRQELQRPVPTGEPEMRQEQWISRSSLAADLQRPPDVESSPKVPSARPPLPTPRPQRVESAPREFDLQGQISRQPLADRPRAAQPLVDTGTVAQQPAMVTIAAPPAELQRQRNEAAERAVDLEPARSERSRLMSAPPRGPERIDPQPTLDSQPCCPGDWIGRVHRRGHSSPLPVAPRSRGRPIQMLRCRPIRCRPSVNRRRHRFTPVSICRMPIRRLSSHPRKSGGSCRPKSPFGSLSRTSPFPVLVRRPM